METKELLLKTAFCCMACDGEIAKEETQLLKKLVTTSTVFDGLEVEKLLNEYVNSINTIGLLFLDDYLRELKEASLEDKDALKVIDIAFQTIESDCDIQYSEISFFKRIRKQLNITDQNIEAAYPNKEDLEDYLLQDIVTTDNNWEVHFANINLFDA